MSDQPGTELSVIKLIPDDLLNELTLLRETFSQSYWRLGDIANQIYEICLAHGFGEGSKMGLYSLIGRLVGKSGRSIRGYSLVSGFFPENVRSHYAELPYSHFSFAMQFKGEKDGQPIWKIVLDRSLAFFVDRGIQPSVERLEVLIGASMAGKEPNENNRWDQPGTPPDQLPSYARFPEVQPEGRADQISGEVSQHLHEGQLPEEALTPEEANSLESSLLAEIDNNLGILSALVQRLAGIAGDQPISREAAIILVKIRGFKEGYLAIKNGDGKRAYFPSEVFEPEVEA